MEIRFHISQTLSRAHTHAHKSSIRLTEVSNDWHIRLGLYCKQLRRLRLKGRSADWIGYSTAMNKIFKHSIQCGQLKRNYCKALYEQGQLVDSKIREYFYYIDHDGMVRIWWMDFQWHSFAHPARSEWSIESIIIILLCVVALAFVRSYFWTMLAWKISRHASKISSFCGSFFAVWDSIKVTAIARSSRICRCAVRNVITSDVTIYPLSLRTS